MVHIESEWEDGEDYDMMSDTDEEHEEYGSTSSWTDDEDKNDELEEDNGEENPGSAEDRVSAALTRTAAMFSMPEKPRGMVILPEEPPKDHHFFYHRTQPPNGNFFGRVAKEQQILFSALPEGKHVFRAGLS